jgi:hypothetical protein
MEASRKYRKWENPDLENNKLTITLTEEVAKRIGNRLSALFDNGEIVVSEIKEGKSYALFKICVFI